MTQHIEIDPPATARPPLSIGEDAVFAILLKARQFDAKVAQTDPDSGSNPTDDASIDALEFGPGDDTRHELVSAIHDLNDDEQTDLVSLILVGRGDFTLAEWGQARDAAAEVGRGGIVRFVTEIPLVSDDLEEALTLFDLGVAEYLDRH